MKIFIGGSKSVSQIDDSVKEKLSEMIKDGSEILIGDCRGIDTAVQQFFADNMYDKVTVYATDGIVRNNVGEFQIKAVPSNGAVGFEFYRKKDSAMANDADSGFMIWDRKSKGTKENILELAELGKNVMVYFTDDNSFQTIQGIDGEDLPINLK